jgi:hypothetical protein
MELEGGLYANGEKSACNWRISKLIIIVITFNSSKGIRLEAF